MADLFATGRIIDIILALVVLELVTLSILNRTAGLALAMNRILPLIAAGVFLLLAVRAALSGASWETIALLLALALVSHLFDLMLRIKDAQGRGGAHPHGVSEGAG